MKTKSKNRLSVIVLVISILSYIGIRDIKAIHESSGLVNTIGTILCIVIGLLIGSLVSDSQLMTRCPKWFKRLQIISFILFVISLFSISYINDRNLSIIMLVVNGVNIVALELVYILVIESRVKATTHKKAKSANEAYAIQETYEDKPHGWIQWKGTNACVDIRCKCGETSHVDASFMYHVQCPYCEAIYLCNGHIELIEIEENPGNVIVSEKD